MQVKLVSVTKIADDYLSDVNIKDTPEALMAYCARVSNPNNQNNPDYEGLLKYCIKHQHWSVFEHSNMTLEIETTLPIATQILRHRSFCFQQFSRRYSSDAVDFERIVARGQDLKNRQNSIDNLSPKTRGWFQAAQKSLNEDCRRLYEEALKMGIAKEQARFLLSQATLTKIYMTGNVRSWIHYISLRSANGTQKEHMDIALEAKRVFCEQYPTIAKALEWGKTK